jgi:arsenate reductase (thioredoxin)
MRMLAAVAATLAIVCRLSSAAESDATRKVVFVCEHGNVKSLMAASYFNQLATQRGLPFRAVSRGVAPDSTTVPKPIVAGLHADGVDVSGFHPSKLAATDIVDAARVVAIGTELPANATAAELPIERWNDVPPASTNYDAARISLKAHVTELLDRLDGYNRRK